MITDDPDKRAEIAAKLANLQATARSEEVEHAAHVVESLWRKDWPFLSRDEYLLLAPVPDAARCAGPPSADDPACARDWDPVISSHATP
jgi:hypothetical protein